MVSVWFWLFGPWRAHAGGRVLPPNSQHLTRVAGNLKRGPTGRFQRISRSENADESLGWSVLVNIIPVIGTNLWHFGILLYKTSVTKFSEDPIPPPDIARKLHSNWFSLDKLLWFEDDRFSPLNCGEANPFPTSIPEIPRWVVPAKSRARGCVYFIRAVEERSIKIGWAVNPNRRLKELQTGCPSNLVLDAVIPDQTIKDEKAFHRLFAKYHWRGEWYCNEGELTEFIVEKRKEWDACQKSKSMG